MGSCWMRAREDYASVELRRVVVVSIVLSLVMTKFFGIHLYDFTPSPFLHTPSHGLVTTIIMGSLLFINTIFSHLFLLYSFAYHPCILVLSTFVTPNSTILQRPQMRTQRPCFNHSTRSQNVWKPYGGHGLVYPSIYSIIILDTQKRFTEIARENKNKRCMSENPTVRFHLEIQTRTPSSMPSTFCPTRPELFG